MITYSEQNKKICHAKRPLTMNSWKFPSAEAKTMRTARLNNRTNRFIFESFLFTRLMKQKCARETLLNLNWETVSVIIRYTVIRSFYYSTNRQKLFGVHKLKAVDECVITLIF